MPLKSQQLIHFACFIVLVLASGVASDGDNLCVIGSNTVCCPGWLRDSTTNKCSIPVCDSGCGSGGQCIGPNLCFCPDSVVQYSCDGRSSGGSGGSDAVGIASCPRPCENGGRCVAGGRCQCAPGFSGSACQFATCPNYCSGNGRCLSTGVCSCNDGFSGPSCDVVDKGPCYSNVQSASGSCSGQLTSVFISREECCNSFGRAWGFACRSCRGAGGSGCGFGRISSGRACVKLNFCSIPGICGGGSCLPDGESDIRCLCSSGLTYNRVERRCERLQSYCDAHVGVCGVGGTCISNGPTDFRCQCFPGFELSSDGKSCSERVTDLCTRRSGLCSHGSCVNTVIGGRPDFQCRCNSGYEAAADGRSCRRRQQNYCQSNPGACSPGGVCRPVGERNFYCSCRPGYRVRNDGLNCLPEPTTTVPPPTTTTVGDACTRQRTCPSDIGECLAIGASPSDDSYICFCRNPDHRQSADSRSCLPAQLSDAPQPPAPQLYCEDATRRVSVCQPYGRCVSVSATDFYCDCQTGYRPADDRRSCLPDRRREPEINPCQVFDICRNGACQNLGSGRFQCVCYRGFELTGDQQNCRLSAPRVTFCQRNPTVCGPNGACVDRGGRNFACACNAGYVSGPGGRACVPGRAPAPPKETALAPTGFPLPSDPLQRLFHKTYCQKFGYVCGRGRCHDLNGSHQFTCSCASGYRLSHDKRFCLKADMRETGYCAERPGVCGGMGHCVNSPASGLYQCFCYPGFKNVDPQRRRCEPYDYNADTNKVIIHGLSGGRGSSSSSGSSGSSDSSSGGDYAHLGSPDRGVPDFSIDGSLTVVREGPSRRRDLASDQYASLSGGGACQTLTLGGGSGEGPCQNGRCLERGRDFECSCYLGFRQAADKKSCVDIDECSRAGSDLCLMGDCINTPGSYTCRCYAGFALDSRSKLCRDRNECQENPSLCQPYGECVNEWGGYECRCRSGARHNDSSRVACVPSSAAPAFSISGSLTVHQTECPDCLNGCRGRRPEACLCLGLRTAVYNTVCAPRMSKPVRISRSSGSLQLSLPAGSSPSSVVTASRRVQLHQCRMLSRSVRFSLVECSFSNV
ncbi:hypothetical protein BOX15_Mlig022114g1 [Macrostomum lignano]|uniref:Uncharacterized protein n=1 Tax=Macrostomum lignano TaxID=282301 RepID=A0A267F6F5_9PLAT|nr:hypothetical protein BOX15_Mlig022114g1 [Macrostomum lignano]